MICQRCRKPTTVYSMSFFNTQDICLECQKREQAHPLYAHAKEVEYRHVKNGNLNFAGIGLPVDLEVQ